MWAISKRMEIAGAHKLKLSYESACCNLHGHNWIVIVHCATGALNRDGMVIDFKHIKNAIHDKLDHKTINELVEFNPTAENIATWIANEVNQSAGMRCCYKVEVQESEGNTAVYIDEQLTLLLKEVGISASI